MSACLLEPTTTCGGYFEYRDVPRRRMRSHIRELLAAMQATGIPADDHGLWYVRKRDVHGAMMMSCAETATCTELRRYTDATLFNDGELVMVDHVLELQTHLEFALRARGRVLVTGLGLGCVVRGLLAHGRCEAIMVIERDASVIKLVAPYMDDRISIVQADILDWMEDSTETYDYAWHDLWSDLDKGDLPLSLAHAEVIYGLRHRVSHQGAWKFPREFRRLLEQSGYGLGS